MDEIKTKIAEVIDFCENNGDPAVITKYSRYFKEGYDGYGIPTDKFEQQRDCWLQNWKSEMDINQYLDLGDQLVATGKFDLIAFAIHFIAAQKQHYTIQTFTRVGHWLESGIQNWANTDGLCMLVLPEFLFRDIIQYQDFEPWIESDSKWKRRAVPVTMVEAIKKKYPPEPMFPLIDKMMMDPEEDVQKGLGTLCREMWKKYPEPTEAFLMKWKNDCGRKIIQYATEKMDKEYRQKFRRAKK